MQRRIFRVFIRSFLDSAPVDCLLHAFWYFHSCLGSTSWIYIELYSDAINFLISNIARYRPMQTRPPPPKDKSTVSFIRRRRTSKFSEFSSLPCNQRSGLKSSASSPNTPKSRFVTKGLIPALVPAGRYRPSGSVNPPSGTTRSKIIAIPGLTRRASRITASRYGRSRISFQGAGEEIPAALSSVASLAVAAGDLAR